MVPDNIAERRHSSQKMISGAPEIARVARGIFRKASAEIPAPVYSSFHSTSGSFSLFTTGPHLLPRALGLVVQLLHCGIPFWPQLQVAGESEGRPSRRIAIPQHNQARKPEPVAGSRSSPRKLCDVSQLTGQPGRHVSVAMASTSSESGQARRQGEVAQAGTLPVFWVFWGPAMGWIFAASRCLHDIPGIGCDQKQSAARGSQWRTPPLHRPSLHFHPVLCAYWLPIRKYTPFSLQ